MGKKLPVIKTKRLLIQPMTNEEIRELIAEVSDEDLKEAYKQMLSGCEENPEKRDWYAPWKMLLKKEGTHIGELGFKGEPVEKTVEIGYGILKEYEGNGYTTEAVDALILWAYGSGDVYFVEAETEPDNEASKRVLNKLEFVPDGEGEERLRFVKESEQTNWVSVYMLFGLSIGTAIGSQIGSIAIGTALGICLGMLLGVWLNSAWKKEREKARENRKKLRN